MKRLYAMLALLALAAFTIGCDQDFASSSGTAPSDALPLASENSVHVPNPLLQDGALIDWGGEYQLKFTVNRGKKQVTMYLLSNDGKTPRPIRTAKIFLLINEPQKQIELTALPLESDLAALPPDGDRDGGSSRFVGIDEVFVTNNKFSGTISGMVEGTPYSGDFKGQPSDNTFVLDYK